MASNSSFYFSKQHLRVFPHRWTPGIAVDAVAEIATLTMETKPTAAGGGASAESSNCRRFPTLDYRFGPGGMSFEAKCSRHVVVAIPGFAIGSLVTMSPRQYSA